MTQVSKFTIEKKEDERETSQSIAAQRGFKIESILWTEQEGALKNLVQKWVYER